jgi:epoxyqueuosine reductase QueG
MGKNKNYSGLKKYCREQGADLFGVADIGDIRNDFLISQEVLKNLDKAVCLGIRLSASILGEISTAPTRLYFHHYRTLNALLDQTALKVSNYIQRKGFLALPIPASQILDWEKQKGHLSHKQLGFLAGLGWIGRNNLLVNEKLGSGFRLVSILTNMPLKVDKPSKDSCLTCSFCIKACPAGAIKDSPADFDHARCFEKLKEFQKQHLVDQYVCGVCVKVCVGSSLQARF